MSDVEQCLVDTDRVRLKLGRPQSLDVDLNYRLVRVLYLNFTLPTDNAIYGVLHVFHFLHLYLLHKWQNNKKINWQRHEETRTVKKGNKFLWPPPTDVNKTIVQTIWDCLTAQNIAYQKINYKKSKYLQETKNCRQTSPLSKDVCGCLTGCGTHNQFPGTRSEAEQFIGLRRRQCNVISRIGYRPTSLSMKDYAISLGKRLRVRNYM